MNDETLRLLANMGFPALVAGFLLLKLNGKLEKLTEAMIQVREKMDRLIDALDRHAGQP